MPPSTPNHAILNGLNDAQKRAVTSKAATVAILAGPGSGKTHTLTARVAWLVDHVGFRPEDVIVATFTVKAAREMKERIGKALGNDREKRIILGTFHSIARRYLAAYGRHIGLSQKFGIADDTDSRAIISRICKRLQLNVDPAFARAWISKKKAKGTEDAAKPARQEVTNVAGLQNLETCYREYQKHLETTNLLDYDDLLVRCVELLRKFPSCVSNVQTVLIDEYQDTNGIQYELMKLFAQRHQRITIVGDPDQSIYGWRSAEIRNLWRLLREFPKTDEVSLEENYRSSQSILDLSLSVIKQDSKRYDKVLKAIHNMGSRPVLRRLKSASAEAEWIVSEVRRVLTLSGSMLTYNDVAILLRSASLSRHIESSLGKAGIAYKMVGGFKFYERTEIRTLLDYLRVIHQPENNDALARILNVPRRGVGDVTIRSLLEEAETHSLSVWTVLSKHCRGDRTAKTRITKQAEQKLSGELLRPLDSIRRRIGEATGPNGTPLGLVQMIEQLLTTLEFEKHLKTAHPDDHEQRWANVQEFISLASDFVRDMGSSDEDALPEIEGLPQTKEVEVLSRFLANVSLASDAQTGDADQSKPLVTISTIHAAKGLEWPIVFVPAVYKGSIPHIRSEDDNEERRLLYVAMTRAQSLLYLSCPVFSSNGNGERTVLSPFVEPVERAFMKKGPCLDRPVMSEIARILQRQLPPEDSIFQGLPAMFSLEDNLFPVDPEEAKQDANGRSNRGHGYHPDAQPSKRPRLQAPSIVQDSAEETQWWKGYSTTMEQSSTFTVAALPGFVSVAAHQAAITAANTKADAAQKAQVVKRPTSKRPTGQKSIMGFVKLDSDQSGLVATRLPATVQPSNSSPAPRLVQEPQAASAAIAPDLAGHRLGAGKLIARPSAPIEEKTLKRKQYTCFSSSPTRPAAAEDDSSGKNTAEADNNETPPEPTRAAACLHVTTCALPKGHGGVLRRPGGLSRENITPIEKLRKPFKPLTITLKRPS
ncbi:P-loop containing nucleoside triphosphate hydrolase protein [Parathielavia appendiculata]|uniref:DNA 3'-5' helicase n=1 Tax=Parathielavia appendiculata TaxID=2587402 RepID=A0AAN6U959_9PEZI|nr:P-loop containing nucleoside triphosphate hydrolase protein [Parathielavia appendiculata]